MGLNTFLYYKGSLFLSMKQKTRVFSLAFYAITIILLSLALASIGQGFLFQAYKEIAFAIMNYAIGIMLIFVSFIFFKKAHIKRISCK